MMAITVQSKIAFGLWFKVHFCDEHHMAIPRLHGLRFDKAKVSWVLKAALLFLDARLLLGRVIGNIGELARFGRHGEQGDLVGGALARIQEFAVGRNLDIGHPDFRLVILRRGCRGRRCGADRRPAARPKRGRPPPAPS